MITILQRYITRTIVLATCFAALIVTGVLFMLTLVGELKNIGIGDYHFLQALLYVFMRMPMQLYQFTPILILLGSIVGLSLLTSHRELSVMRTSGFSTRRILISVFSAALLITFAISIIGESIAPKLSYDAEIQKENAKNAGQAVVTGSGIWLHEGNNFIHVGRVIANKQLEDITRYEFDDRHQLLTSYYAKRMVHENHKWMAKEVVKTTFRKSGTKSAVIPSVDWKLNLNTNLLRVGMRDPGDMSLPRLAKFAQYLENNGLQAMEFKFEFWQRLLQPIASLIMVFLAVPFVLGTLGTTSLGLRMLIGIIIGFIFFIMNALLGQLCIVYQIPAFMAAVIPLMIFALIGVIVMRRLTT